LKTPSPNSPVVRRPARYARWRAATLASVYVLFGIHIAHWKITGRTLAPLELNEVMYTLELGVVTAGFLFMAVACLATLVFGRFFCSWGCHILALEDLCSWILGKLRVRPKPVRSRILLLVPPAALFYMFFWPQVSRILQGRPAPSLRLMTDADGWASFLTTDYWRNLPSLWVTLITFSICGFGIVYVLGSRAFCTYGCPYGAVFRALDRFAPGRIVAAGDCGDCGACTAACQSQVRVKDELVKYGMVVNPACMKDLDCVAACPNGEVRFGFRKPPGLRSFFDRRRIALAYDFTLGEDLLMAVVFVATLLVFRGLYDTVPFLLSLALGGIAAYLAVVTVRVARRRDVRWNDFQMKRAGRITPAGAGFLSIGALAAGFTAHSGWIRVHDRLGTQALAAIEGSLASGAQPDRAALEAARTHLEICRRWGLLVPPKLDAEMARVDELCGDEASAEKRLRSVLERLPDDPMPRLILARVLMRAGRQAEAAEILRSGLEGGPRSPRDRQSFESFAAAAHVGLGEILADEGRLEDAAGHLREAVALRPLAAPARYELGVVLTALGRANEAIAEYEEAVRLDPRDPDLLNNLGYLLLESDRLDEAEKRLRQALQLFPDHAAAHFNLGRLLSRRGVDTEASMHLEAAARLDQRFAGR
jgi:tetratricopeptide (TPR) repeat protein/polyferredoxin